MAIFRCKMCGGDLENQDGATSCVCEFCGTRQTLPSNQDENLQGLFNRANVLRIKSEFDKAADIYEKILQADQTEAEAYWGLILCKYGIEYVEDPATYKRIPTCHRASYDAVTTDEDYKNALKYADSVQRELYETEAAKIEEIQKGILAIAQKESPYDVFICYKETDDSGNRTQDSVIGNDIYYQLTNEGFKVFYAAISLEDKLGSEYEPVIFSALNTAKVMLVLGTKPEYFNAVWVKNEWSRFLKIMKKDRTRLMIPCYKDMDPYELPEEFAHLQSQDMGKIGFINDLVRGIQKVINPETSDSRIPSGFSPAEAEKNNTEKLLERGRISLEDREWETADAIFEQVLTRDVYCAPAYYGKFIAKYRLSDDQSIYNYLSANFGDIKPKQEISDIPIDFSSPSSHALQMAYRYAIPGFLAPETIISQYQSPIKYESVLVAKTNSVNSQLHTITTDRVLARACSYADDDFKTEINSFITNLRNKANDLVMDAKKIDDKRKWNAHNAFINQTDQDVISMNQMTLANFEYCYSICLRGIKYLEQFQTKTKENKNQMESYRAQLETIRWYKDSEGLIAECNDFIEDCERNAERRKIFQYFLYIGWILPCLLLFLFMGTMSGYFLFLLVLTTFIYIVVALIYHF